MISPKRAGISGAAVLILAIIAYSAWWLFVAGQVESGFARWVADQRAAGQVIGHTPMKVGGYPFKIRPKLTLITFESVKIDTALATATFEDVVAETKPWSFSRIDFNALARVVSPGSGSGGFDLQTDTVVGQLGMSSSGKIESVDLRIQSIGGWLQSPEGRGQSGGADTPSTEGENIAVTVERLGVEMRVKEGSINEAVAVNAAIEGILFPDFSADDLLLGNRIERFSTQLLIDPILNHEDTNYQSTADAVAAWHVAGGVIDVADTTLQIGPLRASLAGPVSVDEALQPTARVQARIQGLETILRAGVQTGAVTREMAQLFQGIAGLMSRPDENGVPTVELPIEVRNRGVFIGPAKVADVPPVTWD